VVLRVVERFSAKLLYSGYRVYLVTGDDTTPEADVRPTLTLGSIAFDRQVLHGRRWRDRVERHVHDGRHASGKGSPGTCPETFPIRATWFIQVHVYAWEKRLVSLGHPMKKRKREGPTLRARVG